MTFTTDRSILPFLLILTIFSNFVPIPVYAQYGKVEPNSKLDHVVLQLPYYHMFNYAGFYAAQDKGFYREEGLAVEILEGSPEFTPTEKILAGEATFGIQNDDLLLEYLAGKDVIVLAVLFQHSSWALMVNAESDYESPQDLAGRKIALELNSRDAAILAMLKHEGVSIDSVTKVRASWDALHIFDGSIDARLVYLNDPELVNLSNEGKRFRLIKPINYGIDFYGDSLFTSVEQIQREPGRVAAFRQATLRGWNYALDNPDEIIEVILKKQGVKERGLTRELFQFEAAETRKLMSYPLVEVGHMNRHRWEKMAHTFVSLGMVKPDFSLEGFIYDPEPSFNYAWVRWLAVVCGGTLLCLVGVIIWNWQLQHRVALKTRQYQESEEKYRVVAETATDGIISIDKNSTILYANPALGKIFGYHADDLIGKSLTTLMPSDLRDKHLRSIGQFIVTGQKQTSWNGIELKGMRSDNRTIPIEVSFGVIKEKPDRFIFTGIIRDITERKKAQDALSESERALSTLMSNLQGMAYRCRNNEDWTMEFVSQGSLELTGYAPSDLVNNQKISFANLMIPEERKPIWNQVQEALSNREAYEFTFRIKTSQDTEKWVWERGRGVFSKQGDVIALEGFIMDISARIQAEKKLRHAHDELELRVRERTQELSKALENLKMAQYELVHVEKMAALGHLVAGVAHEINTPLGAIRSSNKNTLAALDSSMHHLPKLFEVLPAELQRDFFLLLDRDARVNHILTTKEKRKEKKT